MRLHKELVGFPIQPTKGHCQRGISAIILDFRTRAMESLGDHSTELPSQAKLLTLRRIYGRFMAGRVATRAEETTATHTPPAQAQFGSIQPTRRLVSVAPTRPAAETCHGRDRPASTYLASVNSTKVYVWQGLMSRHIGPRVTEGL
jgi:hypothetical protein